MLRRTFAVAALLMALSCKKSAPDNSNPNSHTVAGDVKAAFTINLTTPGRAIPQDFTGLSFESGALPDTTYFKDANTTFINLIKGLGQGVLRVGGNTVDRMPWISIASPGVDRRKVITNDDIDRFFRFAGATNWKVMYGLNLGTENARYDAMEAAYIYNHYSNQLLCLEIGNEPDFYYNNGLRPHAYSYPDFRGEFNNYYDSITAKAPNAVFSGPTTASNTNTWLVPFVKDEHSRVRLLTQHYYKMGPATDPSLTIAKLLNGNSGILSQARTMEAAAGTYHLPYRIAECNSVFGGGKTGISNTLASALWGLDFMFTAAEQGAAGINFHGGGKGPYTPIAFSQGQFSPRPLYYGMLLFSKAAAGNILQVLPDTSNRTDSLNLTAHAVRQQDGTLLVLLINKDLSKEAFVTLSTGDKRPASADCLRLTGASPSADTGITLGGNQVNVDGTWSAMQNESAALTSHGCTVKVPAFSAVLLRIQ